MRFDEMNLSDKTKSAVRNMGFVEATPIQERAIEPGIAGRDIMGQAATGTGKTAAFAIPMAEMLEHNGVVQAIVLCPTRELGMQVAAETNNICNAQGIRAIPIYGGQPIDRQIRALRQGAEIVVGTPGRVMDHLRRNTLNLSRVKMCVLDEADEMLDMGFYPDILYILRHLPRERQTMLFSATMPVRIKRIAARYMVDPVEISLNTEQLTVAQTSQVFYELDEHEKLDGLCQLLDAFDFSLSLVFCRQKRDVDWLARSLIDRGYNALGLHGDLNQSQRDNVMRRFREGSLEILVATDVAARGLDISGITHVINYHLPQDPERYVHRIGRTGRAGREGAAITFVTPREYYDLLKIQETANVNIWQEYLPTEEDVLEARIQELHEVLEDILDDEGFERYRDAIDDLASKYDIRDVAAALLRLNTERARRREKPREAQKSGSDGGKARLFVTVGRNDGIKAPEIASAIAEMASIPREVIGRVDLRDRFTFVEVPVEDAERVIEALHQSIILGHTVQVEHAKKDEKRRSRRR